MAWDDTPDTELLEGLRTLDVGAFRSLSNRYAPIVFRFVRPHVGDHTRAAWITELLMARFLVLSRSIPNPSINYLFDLTLETISSDVSDTPGAGLSKKQLNLLEKLTAFSLLDRIIIEMVRFEGAPPEVVSRRLSCTPVQINSALAQLDRLTVQSPSIPMRRPRVESRTIRPSGKPPDQRPRPETRRYYNDSNRDRRGQH